MMISPSAVKWALVGIIPGVALGVFILLAISTEILGVFISLLLLVFVGIQVTRFHLKQTSKTILIGGFLGGIMSNTVGMPGVALALTMSKFEGPTFRSTINACVVMISVISSVVLIVAGEVATSHLKLASYTLIGALIGFKISGPLRHLVDRKGITEITYAISALGSMILLIRSVI